jgi:hypothetical protein
MKFYRKEGSVAANYGSPVHNKQNNQVKNRYSINQQYSSMQNSQKNIKPQIVILTDVIA